MVGLCGVVGDIEYGVDPLAEELAVSDDEQTTRFVDDQVEMAVSAHPQFHETQPVTAADGCRLWIHGRVFGSQGARGNEADPTESTSDSEYCTRLYDERSLDFVADLNGEFVGVVLDPTAGEVHLFTDRIGSIPLFFTRTEEVVLFATKLQAIGRHPAYSPSFDRDHLAEFFAVQKPFGIGTVLEDVSQLPPASIRTVGLDTTPGRETVYWRPQYRPVDRSPAELTEVMNDTMAQVLEDRLQEDLEYGVMLSGGTDSRLVLAWASELDHQLTAFHLTNWQSRETEAAERVAAQAGVDLQVLRRDRDYHADLLDRVPEITNFVGTFDEYVASGFEEELDGVDVVLSGYLGDTMFGAFPLYRRTSPLPFALPFERRVETIPEYVELYLDRYETAATVPDFLDAQDISEVLLERIDTSNGQIDHHGVRYPSLREVQLCEYYPLSNQYPLANSDSLRQITGHTSPFFDSRLVEVHLTIPVRDRLRYDPIALALRERSPALASIPHGFTGVPPAKSVQYGPALLVRKVIQRLRHRVAGGKPPQPFLNHGPWMDEAELIRYQDFVQRAIERNQGLIAELPCLDRDEIDRYYAEHLAGQNHWRALYALVTLLESPVASRIADRGG